jgi:hypothetical protein
MSLASRIEAVTVFRRGARVTRRAIVKLEDGTPAEVSIDGLPLCLDDGSVRVRFERSDDAEGTLPIAGAVRVSLDVADGDAAPAPADDDTLRAARDELARLKSVDAQLDLDLGHLAKLTLRSRPSRAEGEPPAASPTAARSALLALRAKRRHALEAERAELAKHIRDAKKRVAELRDRNERASTARQPREHELRKRIVVSLRGGDGAAQASLLLDYLVPGARWAPSYRLRLHESNDDAALQLRAQVAQKTGEDWTAARITLSTAAADAWTELAELPSRRIGRKQPPPRKRGWRAPPTGADALYGDYDRALRRLDIAIAEADAAPAPAAEDMAVMRSLVASAAEEAAASDMPMGLREHAPLAGGMPQPQAARAPAPMGSPAAALPRAESVTSFAKARGGMFDGEAVYGTGGLALNAPADVSEEPTFTDPKLGYGRMRMQPPTAGARGTLMVLDHHALYMELFVSHTQLTEYQLSSSIEHACLDAEDIDEGRLPSGHHFDWSGHYDYAYATDSPIDVPSDGEFHNIPVSACDGQARLLHVVVPRESEDVFRVSRIANALGAPLMAGPVDVYVGTDFLVTSEVSFTPPAGELRIGLGVAQGIKVARNTRYREESAGLMKGSLVLRHEIEIDVANHSGRPIDLEVRERVPVTRDGEDDIKLEVGNVSPAWDTYDPKPKHDGQKRLRGGHRWKLALADGASQKLSASYMTRIAAKHQLVGGNRRER